MKSQSALCAKAIKSEIKKLYPDAVVKVSSSRFSMGDSVDAIVYGVDESEKEKIREIGSKYQYGHFNGMEDIYENSNSRDDIPQAKYVHVSFREIR
jgi:copper chaperone CopZ